MSGPNSPYTKLDNKQVAQQSFEEANDAVRVRPIAGTLVTSAYDYVAVTYPTTTQEVYTFLLGGSGGTLVNTVTINYVDSTKAQLLNVAKT